MILKQFRCHEVIYRIYFFKITRQSPYNIQIYQRIRTINTHIYIVPNGCPEMDCKHKKLVHSTSRTKSNCRAAWLKVQELPQVSHSCSKLTDSLIKMPLECFECYGKC